MAPRKRGWDEMESSEPPKDTNLLERIRNMWEFACVMQYIFTFGKVVKIDEEFDIEVPAPLSPSTRRIWFPHKQNASKSKRLTGTQDFEIECLKPEPSDKLDEIGLALLKWISSHRGLTFVPSFKLDNLDTRLIFPQL